MMRSYVAAACAFGLATGAACAQSSVSIYGRLDASVQRVTGGPNVVLLNDGVGATSHIGFRGTEDLGGGLAAIFDLEAKVQPDTGLVGAGIASGTNPNTGQTGVFSRNSYVGLKGGFGSVVVGRAIPAGIRALSNFNAIVSGINTGMAGNVARQGIGNDFWNNNMIRYDSPEFGGFSGSVNYALGEIADNTNYGRSYAGTVFWKGAGLVLAASKQVDAAQKSGDTVDWSVLSASYTRGPFKVTAGYDRVKNPTKIAGWVDSKLWTVGTAYTVSPAITVAAQYFNLRETPTGTTSKQLVLNAVYSLSKRTNIYLMATRTDNGALAVMPLYNTSGVPNTTASGVALGMQHYF